MREKKKRLNEDIRANIVQVIHDSEGNLWEMTLSEALEKAKADELDLMEIGQNGDIVIVKMIDYGKHLYRMKKQEQKQKQKWKSAEMKTIRLTYKIWEHDLEVKKKQAEKFFEDGNPLKVTLMLRGRENHYGELAAEKMNHFVNSIEEIYKLDNPVKRMWNTFHAMLKPKK